MVKAHLAILAMVLVKDNEISLWWVFPRVGVFPSKHVCLCVYDCSWLFFTSVNISSNLYLMSILNNLAVRTLFMEHDLVEKIVNWMALLQEYDLDFDSYHKGS